MMGECGKTLKRKAKGKHVGGRVNGMSVARSQDKAVGSQCNKTSFEEV